MQEKLFKNTYQPLAEQIRPEGWDDFKGAREIAPGLIDKLKEDDFIPPSLILWGNPGCGKTTFARLIQKSTSLPFVSFSAVLGGVKEVRRIVEEAEKKTKPTILFVDEIHRFSKSQQDAFLPHVERGTIILIGATTENPSFYLNSALLSRARVLKFPSLDKTYLEEIILKASKQLMIELAPEVQSILIRSSDGDARKLLNSLEQISLVSDKTEIFEKDLKDIFSEDPSLFYDRGGEEHYNLISAFIKSLRGTDADAALYWGFRMLESGEDPLFLIRRMIIFASEDIGNADPRALTLATDTLAAFQNIGLPEGKIPIAQCITYLATSPKSNHSYAAMHKVTDIIKQTGNLEVPLHLRNAPTKLMKEMEYGKDYQYAHGYDGAFVPGAKYLPEELLEKKFYEPSDRGYEKTIGERLAWLKSKNDLS